MDHLGTRARIEPVADRVHVVEPMLDHHSLRRLGELISDEALESPLRVFEVAAADHEHQRLPATVRYSGEVVTDVAHRLEVDVELQRWHIDPLRAGCADVCRAHEWAKSAVHVNQRLEHWCRGCTLDAERFGRHLRIAPVEEPSLVGLSPVIYTDAAQHGEVSTGIDDVLDRARPHAMTAAGVGAQLVHRRHRQRIPAAAVTSRAADPVGSVIGPLAQRTTRDGFVMLDRAETARAVAASGGLTADRSASSSCPTGTPVEQGSPAVCPTPGCRHAAAPCTRQPNPS